MHTDELTVLQQQLYQTSQKLIAIFKLILKDDEVAANYLLFNLLSKVHQRSPDGMPLGHLNINLSELSSEQAV
jgi:hypothetical protein